MAKLFRKPTLLQVLLQGPASVIANKHVRRATYALLVINDLRLLYKLWRKPRLQPVSDEVIRKAWSKRIPAPPVSRVYARPFGANAMHYAVIRPHTRSGYVVRTLCQMNHDLQ